MSMTKNNTDKFENLDYLDIVQNGKTLLHLEGSEINGKTSTDLAYIVGEKLGEARWFYAIKEKGVLKVKTASIRGINRDIHSKRQKGIGQVLEKEKKENIEFELTKLNMLLEQQEKIFNLQLEGLREKINILKDENTELNKLIDEYEKESEKQKPDLTTLLTSFLTKSANSGPAVPGKLSDNGNGNGIPQNFLESLSGVDWSKVDNKQKIEFYNLFEGIKTSLPIKQKE